MHLKLTVDSNFTSPYAMSVFVALTEKGLPFELATVDLDQQHNQLPAFRNSSLTARVPTLQQDDLVLSESSAITEYLDEVFAAPAYAPLYPADPVERARARQLQAWLRSDLLPLRTERSTRVIFFAPVTTPLSDAGIAARDLLIQVADRFIDAGRPNLFGRWCIADTDLALMLNRLIMNGDPMPAKLQDWAHAQWQRPSVQQWVAQPR
ncbi:glutathione S-transferase [Actimicrobium sp. GrIS 1.19]|uniref:glutathione transferase n=1 Tax=Actimicrobium sp. GrIS 1.19 TaxID=3071708 RepID=UPI002E051D18|nr:glutathione S-transferase [Actimicrobium sp. GrIS 1.19]